MSKMLSYEVTMVQIHSSDGVKNTKILQKL